LQAPGGSLEAMPLEVVVREEETCFLPSKRSSCSSRCSTLYNCCCTCSGPFHPPSALHQRYSLFRYCDAWSGSPSAATALTQAHHSFHHALRSLFLTYVQAQCHHMLCCLFRMWEVTLAYAGPACCELQNRLNPFKHVQCSTSSYKYTHQHSPRIRRMFIIVNPRFPGTKFAKPLPCSTVSQQHLPASLRCRGVICAASSLCPAYSTSRSY
jgi:hypothetical protein